MDASFNSNYTYEDLKDFNCNKGPPPLPPKPKILPIKPSNWGQVNSAALLGDDECFKIPQELPRRLIDRSSGGSNSGGTIGDNKQTQQQQQRNVYLDQPSSSFV